MNQPYGPPVPPFPPYVPTFDNQNLVYAHLVDRVIGSAYDTVRYVAENIEYVKHVSAHLEQIYGVSTIIPEIQAIYAHLAQIEAIYANIADIITVADNINDVKITAANITAINTIAIHINELLAIYANLNALLDATTTPGRFGAIGDGIIDDTNALIAWAASPTVKKGEAGKIYRITAQVRFLGNQVVDWNGSRVLVDFDGQGLDFYNEPSAAYPLTADYVIGSLSLAVTLPVAPTRGQKIKIVSNAVDPSQRDEGTSTNKYRCGEWAVVGVGSTTTNLVLVRPLRFTAGLSEDLLTRGNPYTIAYGARIVILTDAALELNNLDIAYRSGQAWSNSFATVAVLGYDRPIIRSPRIRFAYGTGLSLRGNYMPLVDNFEGENINQYGISDFSYGSKLIAPRFNWTRHGYTTTGPVAAIDTTNKSTLLGIGRTTGATIISGHSHGAGDLDAFDTHHDATDVTFDSCISDSSADHAFAMRGKNIRHVNARCRNSGAGGVLIFTEYDAGDLAPWTSGKLPEDVTSGEVISPDLETTTFGVEVRNAFGKIGGSGTYLTKHPVVFLNTGAVMTIAGSQYATIAAGGAVADSALIEVYEAHSGLLTAIPAAITYIDAPVIIDARASTNSNQCGIDINTNCTLVIRSLVRLLLPASSTLMTTTGTIICEGEGRIEYSKEGAADNTGPLGFEARNNIRVRALDDTVNWDTVQSLLRQLSYNPNVNVSHAGTGAEVQNLHNPPGQSGWPIANTLGTGQWRFVFRGSKTGIVGTAALTIRSMGSNIVINSAGSGLTMPADTVNWELEVNVYLGLNTQNYRMRLTTYDTSDGSGITLIRVVSTAFTPAVPTDRLVRLGCNAAVGDTVTITSSEVFATKGGIYSVV